MQSNDPYTVRRAYKDSLFVHLFSQKEFVVRLYHELHPEDTIPLAEDEVEIVTLSHIFISGQYNGLGFLIRGTPLVLVESQSVWSYNIIYHLLGYAVNTWDRIITDTEQNIDGSKKLELPVPDCYVVFTGKQEVPERIDLKDFFKEDKQMINLSATVITLSRAVKNGIIYQYIKQCMIMDHCMEQYGDDPRQCVEDSFGYARMKVSYQSTFKNLRRTSESWHSDGSHKKKPKECATELMPENCGS